MCFTPLRLPFHGVENGNRAWPYHPVCYEAEIVALSEAAKEGVYLSRFLSDLGLPSADTVALATDNSAARDLAYHPKHHERTKHIERRHFFVRDMVENHMLVVPYVASSDNMADFFTKPLSATDFY